MAKGKRHEQQKERQRERFFQGAKSNRIGPKSVKDIPPGTACNHSALLTGYWVVDELELWVQLDDLSQLQSIFVSPFVSCWHSTRREVYTKIMTDPRLEKYDSLEKMRLWHDLLEIGHQGWEGWSMSMSSWMLKESATDCWKS